MLSVFQFNEIAPAGSTGWATSSVAVKNTDPKSTDGILSSSGLDEALGLIVYSEIAKDSGGTQDVYLQTFLEGVWFDILHIKTVPSGSGTVNLAYVLVLGHGYSAIGVAFGTQSASQLPSDTTLGGPWGEKMRLLMLAGASAVGGGAVKVTIAAQLPRQFHGR